EFYNLRPQYSYSYDRHGHYRSTMDYQFILERVVDITPKDGRFSFKNTAAMVSAGYLIRARQGNSISELRLDSSQRGWYWPGRNDQTPRALRPSAIEMDLPDQAAIDSP